MTSNEMEMSSLSPDLAEEQHCNSVEAEMRGLLGNQLSRNGEGRRAAVFERLRGGGGDKRGQFWFRYRYCLSMRSTVLIALAAGIFLGVLGMWISPRLLGRFGYRTYTGPAKATVATPRAEKWGWFSYHSKLKKKAREEGSKVNVLLLGDSITEEMLGTSLGKEYERGASHDKQTRVWREYYEPLGALNLGVSGDLAEHLLWRLQNGELPGSLQPQSVMVAIGTNNLGRGQSTCDTIDGVTAVVNYLLEARPDALICLMALFPRADLAHQDSVTPSQAIGVVNKALRTITEEQWGNRVHFVDCTDRFLTTNEAGTSILDHDVIKGDNLHLTVAGLEAWALCAAADIKSGLEDEEHENTRT